MLETAKLQNPPSAAWWASSNVSTWGTSLAKQVWAPILGFGVSILEFFKLSKPSVSVRWNVRTALVGAILVLPILFLEPKVWAGSIKAKTSIKVIATGSDATIPSPTSGGSTYYLSVAAGNDANSCVQSKVQSTAKKTFASAWSCLNPGDVLVVADGNYSAVSPPKGKAGTEVANITVVAARDGGAVVADGLALINNSYLQFHGFKVSAPNYSLDAHSNGKGLVTHHVTFKRCGFQTTTTSESGGILLFDGTHHMLFEDFWIWGGGRYAFLCYGGNGGNPPNLTCDFNTLRRGVIRQGPGASSPGNPEAAISLYYGSNNTIENVIALDGNQDSDSSNAAFYITSHSPPPEVSNNKFYGVVALNNNGVGWYSDSDNGAIANGNQLINSVIWGKANFDGMDLYNGGGSCTGNIVQSVTVGSTANKVIGYANCSVSTTGSVSSSLANSLGLKYLVQPAATGGADVTKRYLNGVLTTQSLWPFPNQARIKKDMCTDAGVTTGFCAKASVSHYVWEYLGNTCPAGTCQ